MITLDQIFNSGISIWGVVKIFYLLIILLFGLFALIIIRQVYLMTSTVHGAHNFPLKTISFLFLALVILIFFLALMAL